MILDLENKNSNIDSIIINQFMGLGDILFSIPIAKKMSNIGYKVIWPVNKSFLDIQKNFDYIHFIDKDSFHIEYENTNETIKDRSLIFPLRYADIILNGGNPYTCMSDKYKIVGLPLEQWKTLNWTRDIENENYLYYNVLGLNDDEDYNLINDTYSMDKKIDIQDINENFRNIKFDIIKGFNILDWYKVIENAKNIYTVGTSIVFMIEVIPTNKLIDYYLYTRRPQEVNCDYYNYLLEKPTKEF